MTGALPLLGATTVVVTALYVRELLINRTASSGAPLFDDAANGEASRTRGTAADITELRDAIIAVDEEQYVQVFNAAAEEMFGCLASDAIGAPLDRFIPHCFRAIHGEQLRISEDAGITNRAHGALGQLSALRSNGDAFPVEASLSPASVGARKLSTVIVRDVTDRVRTFDALRESEERFRLMADTTPVMIWMADSDKLCDYCNRSWLEFTGRPIEAELGNGWAEGVHPDDVKQCLDTFEQAFDRREPFRLEYRLRRHDGEYRWVLDTGAPRLSADGAFSGYIGSAIDVTEHKLAERVLSGLSRRLMDTQDKEREWIARELHDDVAQRMALLTIELERLSLTLPADAVALRTHVGELRVRANGLGKDIQEFSHRLHSPKLEYLGIARAARAFCKELSGQQGVTISCTHEGVPEHVPKGVALALFRVMEEALTNAVKHAGVSQVSVVLRGGHDEIHLEVADAGVGFDPKAAVRDRGLGLVSMQERLRLVHGQIAIDSQPGAGTRVHARVPLGVPGAVAGGGLRETPV